MFAATAQPLEYPAARLSHNVLDTPDLDTPVLALPRSYDIGIAGGVTL